MFVLVLSREKKERMEKEEEGNSWREDDTLKGEGARTSLSLCFCLSLSLSELVEGKKFCKD